MRARGLRGRNRGEAHERVGGLQALLLVVRGCIHRMVHACQLPTCPFLVCSLRMTKLPCPSSDDHAGSQFCRTWPLHCSFATMDCRGAKGCLCNPVQGCLIDCQGGSGPAKITIGVCSVCGDETKWTYEGHPWGVRGDTREAA